MSCRSGNSPRGCTYPHVGMWCTACVVADGEEQRPAIEGTSIALRELTAERDQARVRVAELAQHLRAVGTEIDGFDCYCDEDTGERGCTRCRIYDAVDHRIASAIQPCDDCAPEFGCWRDRSRCCKRPARGDRP